MDTNGCRMHICSLYLFPLHSTLCFPVTTGIQGLSLKQGTWSNPHPTVRVLVKAVKVKLSQTDDLLNRCLSEINRPHVASLRIALILHSRMPSPTHRCDYRPSGASISDYIFSMLSHNKLHSCSRILTAEISLLMSGHWITDMFL